LFEADLDSPEEDVLTPDTVTKFLYILTYDKTVKYVVLLYHRSDIKLNLVPFTAVPS
jgi:hypothetical protein